MSSDHKVSQTLFAVFNVERLASFPCFRKSNSNCDIRDKEREKESVWSKGQIIESYNYCPSLTKREGEKEEEKEGGRREKERRTKFGDFEFMALIWRGRRDRRRKREGGERIRKGREGEGEGEGK